MTLSGHKGQVTALVYNQQGGLLASGAQDTDIIVWDVAAESGLYRLRGHQDQVTDLVSYASNQKCIVKLMHRFTDTGVMCWTCAPCMQPRDAEVFAVKDAAASRLRTAH